MLFMREVHQKTRHRLLLMVFILVLVRLLKGLIDLKYRNPPESALEVGFLIVFAHSKRRLDIVCILYAQILF